MEQYIEILNNKNEKFSVIIGEQTTALLARFHKLTPEEKDSLLEETAKILTCCVPPNKPGSETGIAIGYVQSGKTMSFTTLTALAFDNGFRVIIYLAGVKNNLLSQTNNRLKSKPSANYIFFKLNPGVIFAQA